MNKELLIIKENPLIEKNIELFKIILKPIEIMCMKIIMLNKFPMTTRKFHTEILGLIYKDIEIKNKIKIFNSNQEKRDLLIKIFNDKNDDKIRSRRNSR